MGRREQWCIQVARVEDHYAEIEQEHADSNRCHFQGGLGTGGKIATLIADHPQPPIVEKVRILSFTGTEAIKFKRFDKQTHQAAKEFEEAAIKQDSKGVITKFAAL